MRAKQLLSIWLAAIHDEGRVKVELERRDRYLILKYYWLTE